MNIVKFSYKNRVLVLNVENTVYTVGNTVSIIDIYFKHRSEMTDEPSMMRVSVLNENFESFVSQLNSSNSLFDLDKLGNCIESVKFYNYVSGYVEDSRFESLKQSLSISVEESLLEWSDTLANKTESNDDMSEYMSMEDSDMFGMN